MFTTYASRSKLIVEKIKITAEEQAILDLFKENQSIELDQIPNRMANKDFQSLIGKGYVRTSGNNTVVLLKIAESNNIHFDKLTEDQKKYIENSTGVNKENITNITILENGNATIEYTYEFLFKNMSEPKVEKYIFTIDKDGDFLSRKDEIIQEGKINETIAYVSKPSIIALKQKKASAEDSIEKIDEKKLNEILGSVGLGFQSMDIGDDSVTINYGDKDFVEGDILRNTMAKMADAKKAIQQYIACDCDITFPTNSTIKILFKDGAEKEASLKQKTAKIPYVEIAPGIYVNRVGFDVNGNWSYWVSHGSNKSKKIQHGDASAESSSVTKLEDFENPNDNTKEVINNIVSYMDKFYPLKKNAAADPVSIEMEHAPTFKKIRKDVKEDGKLDMKDEDIAKSISEDHGKELNPKDKAAGVKEYYDEKTGLPAFEKKLEKKKEAALDLGKPHSQSVSADWQNDAYLVIGIETNGIWLLEGDDDDTWLVMERIQEEDKDDALTELFVGTKEECEDYIEREVLVSDEGRSRGPHYK
jgi:hypothetical protein